MRLLLTGATGFVGRNFLLRALACGRYEEILAQVRDPAKLRAQLEAEGVDATKVRALPWLAAPPADVDHAVHCAAVLFARDRREYFRVNVDEALRILAPLSSTARVLVLSSQSAGGPTPAGRLVKNSGDPDAPITWYGESKLEMERRLREACPGAMIWRPPMILGPRDRATLPLFKMAAGAIRTKPGLSPKFYSWIDVQDLATAMCVALASKTWKTGKTLGVCAPAPISDIDLISTAARAMRKRGVTMRLPSPLVKLASAVVDAVPALREAVPSLTRDRAREIFPDRWVIDGAEFQASYGPAKFRSLARVLGETRAWYEGQGLLP